MKITPTLSKLAGLSLLLSSNVYAAQLFNPVAGSEAAQAQTELLVNGKASIENGYVYGINAKALKLNTDRIELNLAPGLTVYGHKLSAITSASGSLVWQGSATKSADAPMAVSGGEPVTDSVTLVNHNGSVTGTVRIDGRLFKIQPLKGGLHRVLEINEDNMKPDHPPGAMAELEHQLTERLANQPQQVSQPINNLVTPVIRVMVLYTNGVPAEVGDIPGLIDLAIAETNTGYTNSGVNATVELAHLGSINYNSSSISTDLTRLKSTSDGYMDSAHALRDTHEADIVMLIVPDSGSACGQAGAIGAVASTAFAVTAQDCATGYYSFGHELGHLQSARHNPETDGSTTPYAYGHGYRDPASQWRTVMAYNCTSGCSRINWWSNPSNLRNGTPMGTSSVSDNTRVLNNTAATVAAFRSGGGGGSCTNKDDSVTGLSASSGNWLHYTQVTEGCETNMAVTISGGTGDADLYTRFNSQPTTSSYDCRPYLNGNNETCTYASVNAGTYHLSIRAYSTFSGVTLSLTHD